MYLTDFNLIESHLSIEVSREKKAAKLIYIWYKQASISLAVDDKTDTKPGLFYIKNLSTPYSG